MNCGRRSSPKRNTNKHTHTRLMVSRALGPTAKLNEHDPRRPSSKMSVKESGPKAQIEILRKSRWQIKTANLLTLMRAWAQSSSWFLLLEDKFVQSVRVCQLVKQLRLVCGSWPESADCSYLHHTLRGACANKTVSISFGIYRI